jgi:TolA-binding protein
MSSEPHPLTMTLAERLGSKEQTRFNNDIGLWQIVESQQQTIDDLNEELNQLKDKVEELSAGLENDTYENLTRKQKRLRVKRLVHNEANQNGGRGYVDYNEIRALFNKKIPEGSAHYLMEQIGKEPGYRHERRDNANNVLKVDLSETDGQLFSSE